MSTLLTPADLRAWLKISRTTYHRMLLAGKLPPACKLNSLFRWEPEVVNDWIRAGCPPADEFKVTVGQP